MHEFPFDPQRDLKLERRVGVPPAVLYRCWTEADLLLQWFRPGPWRTTEAEADPRPGGRLNLILEASEGERFEFRGAFLVVEPHRRLVFTDAIAEGWRPTGMPFMAGVLTFVPDGDGAHFSVIAKHCDPATRDQHEDMGFATGWGQALDHLVVLAETLPR